MSGTEDVWVSIYTCRTRQEAGLAVAKLQSVGIQARVDGQEASIYGESWFGNISPMNAKIHVLKRDAAEARAVLEEVDRRRVERITSVPCPKCGQLNPDRVWAQPRLIAIIVAMGLLAALATELFTGWICTCSASRVAPRCGPTRRDGAARRAASDGWRPIRIPSWRTKRILTRKKKTKRTNPLNRCSREVFVVLCD
jgi:hypothetical protein